MITTLDVETTYQDGDPSPYNENNKLVSVGLIKSIIFLITKIILMGMITLIRFKQY